jgi:hypothetical protein
VTYDSLRYQARKLGLDGGPAGSGEPRVVTRD